MFRFVPPEKMSFLRRKSHFRAYQAALDERTAALAGGTLRYHLQQKNGAAVVECVALTDGRVVPYSAKEVELLKKAKEWVENGEGSPPALPNPVK